MIKIELIKAGDILYDCRKVRMGNTTSSCMRSWSVRIISIDHKSETAMVSWNGNPPQKYHRHDLRRLRRKPVKGSQ